MGRAYEAHFRPAAEEAQREAGREHGRGKEKLTADRQEPIKNPTTAKKAAEAVGLSERQYRRGKTITEQATPEVKEAWEQGGMSKKQPCSVFVMRSAGLTPGGDT